jgi:hypothetical protein
VGVPVSKTKKLINSANSQSIPIKIIGEFINDEIQIGENVTSLGELNSLYENSFKVLFS